MWKTKLTLKLIRFCMIANICQLTDFHVISQLILSEMISTEYRLRQCFRHIIVDEY